MSRHRSGKTSHSKAQGPTQRQRRVGEQLRHIVAETLQRGHFHDGPLRDAGRITVTEVRVSPDLRNATAYVMPLGGDEDITPLLAALNEAAPAFQKDIGHGAKMKFTPRIRFAQDQSFDEAARIESILREVEDKESR